PRIDLEVDHAVRVVVVVRWLGGLCVGVECSVRVCFGPGFLKRAADGSITRVPFASSYKSLEESYLFSTCRQWLMPSFGMAGGITPSPVTSSLSTIAALTTWWRRWLAFPRQ